MDWIFERRRIPSALRKGEGRRGNGKLWPGSKSPDSWMAVHGLEGSICTLHSQQTGPDVKPDENWRRNCLISCENVFPIDPKASSLYTHAGSADERAWVASMQIHATKRKRDSFSPVLSSFKQEKPQPECCTVDSNHKSPHFYWVGLPLPTYTKGSVFLPSPAFCCCCLFLCVVVFRALNKVERHSQVARGLLSSSKGCQSSHQQILSLGGGHANYSHL